jgi:undecaprenyl diphosphate synthase
MMRDGKQLRSIPTHIGIILDGNRRWAKANRKTIIQGHRAGYNKLDKVADYAFSKGVKELSVYAFSTENWKRSQEEVKDLMNLVRWIAEKKLDIFHRKGVKIVVSGSKDRVAKDILRSMDEAVEKTKDNKKGTVNICFNYGGRADITEAVRKLVAKGITTEDVSEDAISNQLSTVGLHDVDLVIRTSEYRLSNFLPWESIYAEIYFAPDIYWPDFDGKEFDKALDFFATRKRRFGK